MKQRGVSKNKPAMQSSLTSSRPISIAVPRSWLERSQERRGERSSAFRAQREGSKTARRPPRPRVAPNTAEDDKEVTCVCHLGRLSFIFLAEIREARPPQRRHSLLCDSNLSDARRGALLQPRQATPPKSRLPITEKQALFCRAP